MHVDPPKYFRFTGKARLDKAINSLVGVVEGIAIDQRVNPEELTFLHQWIADHAEFSSRHPFNELVPIVTTALRDGVISGEERDDIVWLCRKLASTNSGYYDQITSDLQRLHGVLAGIAGDLSIKDAELKMLSQWLEDHAHLRTCWPYDEVAALTTNVVATGRLDEMQHALLFGFFSEFGQTGRIGTLLDVPAQAPQLVTGLCAVQPDIAFSEATFCFTGASKKWSRAELTELVTARGGRVVNSVSKKLNYLVVGSDGNPCWSYTCYGRKVEQAMAYRREGVPLVIVHEFDFADAIADN